MICLARKTPKDGKEENIRVRVTPEQKQRLVEYAERHYQSMSGVVCQALDLLYAMNNRLKCRKPVFMRVSGICFIKWLWFGSICGESNGVISFEKVNKKGRRYKLCCQQEKKH